MTTALLLIVFGILSRLAPHYLQFLPAELSANLVPMAALALFAGARLPRRWAFAVPVLAMILSDLIIDRYIYPGFQRGAGDPVRLTIYGTMLAVVALGSLPRKDAAVPTRFALALAGSTLFFLTTNFAVWASGEVGYAKTLSGLSECYVAAIPFFRNGIVADLLGTAFLFGLYAVVHRSSETEVSALPARAD